MSTKRNSRSLGGRRHSDGVWKCVPTRLTARDHDKPVDINVDDRAVIPVIFIPGILATRLKTKEGGKVIWDPPNTIGDKLQAFLKYLCKDTATRVEELDPQNTVIAKDLPDGSDLSKNHPESSGAHLSKGWGALYCSSYHTLMWLIEQSLNASAAEITKLPDAFQGAPQDYGGDEGKKLEFEEFQSVVGKYRFEVWGGGYNWLQSNRQSAEDVWKTVMEAVNAYGKKINEQRKFLIISHSMGGLVARALCRDGARAKKILGVIHIAQPAAGTPTVYKLMRSGYDGLESVVLGRNAADVSGILGAALSGGLELLPFPGYKNGQPWLTCPKQPNQPDPVLHLPAARDPYTDIYSAKDWYGLLPDHNLKYILTDGNDSPEALEKCRERFSDIIENVRIFHRQIADVYHDQTYAIWGEDPGRKTWGEIIWKQREYRDEARDANNAASSESRASLKDRGRGYISHGDYSLFLKGENDAGDSTVPLWSARNQKGKARISFVLGNKQGSQNMAPGWEHQMACNDRRVQWATLHSIIRIVQETNP